MGLFTAVGLAAPLLGARPFGLASAQSSAGRPELIASADGRPRAAEGGECYDARQLKASEPPRGAKRRVLLLAHVERPPLLVEQDPARVGAQRGSEGEQHEVDHSQAQRDEPGPATIPS